MTQANQADFFGEGSADPVEAPRQTLDDQLETKRKRKEWLANQGLDENGNQLPAYGTPISQGGTAQGYQVEQSPIGSYNATQGRYNSRPVQSVQRGDFAGTGGQFLPDVGANSLGSTADDQLTLGRNLADEALGMDPSINPASQVTVSNRDRLTPVVDSDLARNAEIDRAFAMSKDLYDRIMGAPSQAQALGDQALSNQLALARSARGGPGAVQDALGAAQQAAPGLMQQTQTAVAQETAQKNQAAQGALGIYSAVAGNTADRATAIATANQGAGLQVLNNLTTLTGQEMQFDAAKMATVGQLARDFMNNAAAFEGMSIQLQIAQWDDVTKRYGIDKNFDAVVKKIAASESIGPLDAFKLVLGGATALPGLAALI
ncbi:MAG: hypothetical protein A2W26_12930 [Acidobacteria bacterium RBG_16_64_8]|nr:MAG: hypothetical protein A2W26_12930 [Acidobacteria bacterium RBG_16_64_8]